jgi:hypothetical protein
MRRSIGILLLGFALGGGVADAQTSYAGVATCRSFSGQFLIRDLRNGRASDFARRQQTNSAFLRLEPTFLAVSCERIKQAIWDRLGYNDPFRGRIYLTLTATDSLDTEFTISSDRFRDGWAYKVDLPDLVNRERYLQTIVHIVLLENKPGILANVTNRLGDEGINLEAIYITGITDDLVELAVVTDNPKKTKKILEEF